MAVAYIDGHPNTPLVTAADSNAGGLKVLPVNESLDEEHVLPARLPNGAPLDGSAGSESAPFVAAPDSGGNAMHFAIAWAGFNDLGGGVVARARIERGTPATQCPKHRCLPNDVRNALRRMVAVVS